VQAHVACSTCDDVQHLLWVGPKCHAFTTLDTSYLRPTPRSRSPTRSGAACYGRGRTGVPLDKINIEWYQRQQCFQHQRGRYRKLPFSPHLCSTFLAFQRCSPLPTRIATLIIIPFYYPRRGPPVFERSESGLCSLFIFLIASASFYPLLTLFRVILSF
jgi:hypothetical protein